ncbi:MAG: hypothetical protein ACD_58C00050G0001 [uncultured bacterium]|nr:MAG: hypothetical protein ACD_58C00050G0001 [uncultured bacterium]
MSKKKKFKNKFKSEILTQWQNEVADDSSKIVQSTQTESKQITKENTKDNSQILSQDYSYIKKDLIKIAFTILLILLILVGITMINKQSDIISNWSNLITDFLHINR